MDTAVPYMLSVANLHKILDKIQTAGVPEVFNHDFLKDLGFTSSNDRPIIDAFTSSVAFSESDLALFVESNLALCVSSYPAQDDE